MAILDINKENFQQEVLESTLPILIYFWAPWCKPCRLVAPLIERIAVKYAPRLKVVKINTEENIDLTISEGITSIPTFKLYNKGLLVAEAMGNMSEKELEAFLSKALQ